MWILTLKGRVMRNTKQSIAKIVLTIERTLEPQMALFKHVDRHSQHAECPRLLHIPWSDDGPGPPVRETFQELRVLRDGAKQQAESAGVRQEARSCPGSSRVVSRSPPGPGGLPL